MSAAAPGRAQGPEVPPAAPGQEPPEENQQSAPEQQDSAAPPEQPQNARAARRELVDHTPGFILGRSPSFGGALVGGEQSGIAGGTFHGAVSFRTQIHHHTSPDGPRHASGAVPAERLAALSATYQESPCFAPALQRLREERVLILTGAHATGRRAAATMLLHRLGTRSVRALDPGSSPLALGERLTEDTGHLACDLAISRSRPFTDAQLLALREKLTECGSHLVITTSPSALLHQDISPLPWEPPPLADTLRAHLRHLTDEETAGTLMAQEPVRDFLDGARLIGEAAAFAPLVVGHHRGTVPASALTEFGRATVEEQVRAWFGGSELSLRDKSFLLSLAVFDDAPYPLAGEFADPLYVRLQQTEDPGTHPRVQVFGPSPSERLEQARGLVYEGEEATEWGPVPQAMARYANELTAPVLLTEAWTRQPSTRPALVEWVRRLADDGRALVRTRAAAASAALAHADLSSCVGLLITPWADSTSYARRLTAANSLVLTDLLGVSAVRHLLDQWCADLDRPGRRWTGIRAWALLAGLRPELAPRALAAVVGRARDPECEEDELQELADSAALLLTAGRASSMVHELAGLLGDGSSAVRALAAEAFLKACASLGTADAEASLLDRYAQQGRTSPQATRDLAALWNGTLEDADRTGEALTALRAWVLQADRQPSAETALRTLLPALTAADRGRHRVTHLLRTMPGVDGGPPPEVADRLLRLVGQRPAADLAVIS